MPSDAFVIYAQHDVRLHAARTVDDARSVFPDALHCQEIYHAGLKNSFPRDRETRADQASLFPPSLDLT